MTVFAKELLYWVYRNPRPLCRNYRYDYADQCWFGSTVLSRRSDKLNFSIYKNFQSAKFLHRASF